MASVADIVRMQRQALAAGNLNHRLQSAQGYVASALAGTSATMRPQMTAPNQGRAMAEYRAKNAVDAALRLDKEQQKPCPTGYERRASGECALRIETTPGLPGRTEFKGPTLTQNKEMTAFIQPFNRPAHLPGQATSTTLHGLGVALPTGSSATACSTLANNARKLKAEIDANCALLAADAGVDFDVAGAQKFITDVNNYCKVSLAGLGFDLEGPERDLMARYRQLAQGLVNAKAKNPGLVGKACVSSAPATTFTPPSGGSPILIPAEGGGAFVDTGTPPPKVELPTALHERKFPWWLILLGIGGYYMLGRK